MAQSSQQDNLRVTTYRLQTAAYANRWRVPPSPTKVNFNNGRHEGFSPHYMETLSRSGGNFNIQPATDFLINQKTKQRSKSLQQLSSIGTDLLPDHPRRIVVPAPLVDFGDTPLSSTLKQSHSDQVSLPSSSTSLVANPQKKQRSTTARLRVSQAPVPTVIRHRRRRLSLDDDPTKVAMKLSLPCPGGCCYCVFSALLGPVKVYITRADKPKKEPLLWRIKDGNGKPVIPVSRKSDVKGLVYDPVSFSLQPPIKGQRSVLQKRQKQRK